VTQKLNKNPINKILRDKITKKSSNKKELKTRQIVIKRISINLTLQQIVNSNKKRLLLKMCRGGLWNQGGEKKGGKKNDHR
jgi:hypothetical protein